MEDTQNPQQDPHAGQPSPPPSDPQPTPPQAQSQNQQSAEGQKDLSGIMEENVDVSSLVANAGNQQQIQDFIAKVQIPAHPNTAFDEQKFVQLLAGSISLTWPEKERIITAIPQLSQFQIDELLKIFEEEQQKFTELEKKHAEEVAKLEAQHSSGAMEAQQQKAEEDAVKAEEAKQQEELKKQLGL